MTNVSRAINAIVITSRRNDKIICHAENARQPSWRIDAIEDVREIIFNLIINNFIIEQLDAYFIFIMIYRCSYMYDKYFLL